MTTLDDFWTTLQTIHNETYINDILRLSLKEIITSWMTEKYYPVLNITRNFRNSTVLSSYMISPYVKDNIKLSFWTHVTFTTKSSLNFNTSYSIWLYNRDLNFTEIEVSLRPENSDWIIANIKQIGKY